MFEYNQFYIGVLFTNIILIFLLIVIIQFIYKSKIISNTRFIGILMMFIFFNITYTYLLYFNKNDLYIEDVLKILLLCGITIFICSINIQ